ncbi:MAG: PKD domain-containing protein [Deltaproteobacteria bacterium]|nr:PKD domain-containing protein [Deltaproteobacteria bacterium]
MRISGGDVDGFKGELFRSTDGGLTWESLLSDPDIGFQAVQFTSTTRGVLVAVNEDIDETHIYYTTDGGDTWDEGALPPVSGVGNPGTGYVITAVQMMDTNEGWAVGGDPSDTDAVILHTTNGGVSWSADEYRGGGRFLDIHMINERFGYAVGSRSLIAEYYVPGISAPVADAGPDQTVLVNTVVALDGSGSYDPDGDPLTYKWSHSSGPANPPLIVPTNVAPTFTPTVTGDYVIQLVVTDFDTSSAPDTVKITVVDELDDDDADDDVDDDLDDDDDFGPPGTTTTTTPTTMPTKRIAATCSR